MPQAPGIQSKKVVFYEVLIVYYSFMRKFKFSYQCARALNDRPQRQGRDIQRAGSFYRAGHLAMRTDRRIDSEVEPSL